MASLNHVCMWSAHGWVHVTAEEASRIHPGGTVSAHSGLFMCELCGQYVILTDGSIRERYSKHSAAEANKNCPERTFGSAYTPSYSAREYELPIRLLPGSSGFHFEIGLVRIPEEILQKQANRTVTITADNGQQFVFSFERLSKETITYLPLGNYPSTTYSIRSSEDLSRFWPQKVRCISGNGSIFDGQTGRLLPLDADVQIKKKYFLVTTRSYFYRSIKGLSLSKKCEQQVGWRNWYLYEIEASELNEEAAKFFLDLHCRLTDVPMELVPIWPIHIETPYLIKHNTDAIIMHISGSRHVQPKTFPYAFVETRFCRDGSQIVRVRCNDRQQLISAGSANVLQYLYLWNDTLADITPTPQILVCDSLNNELADREHYFVPKDSMMIISTPFDGIAIKKRADMIIEKIALPAQKRIAISNLQLGISVEVYQGLDLVWQTAFKKRKTISDNQDDALYQRLSSFVGSEVEIPHSFGAAAKRLKNYPQTTRWISLVTKKGKAPEKAVRYLINYVSQAFAMRKED